MAQATKKASVSVKERKPQTKQEQPMTAKNNKAAAEAEAAGKQAAEDIVAASDETNAEAKKDSKKVQTLAQCIEEHGLGDTIKYFGGGGALELYHFPNEGAPTKIASDLKLNDARLILRGIKIGMELG